MPIIAPIPDRSSTQSYVRGCVMLCGLALHRGTFASSPSIWRYLHCTGIVALAKLL